MWNGLVNMTSLYNINLDGAHNGQHRSLEEFQFDLENVHTMSQLVGKSVVGDAGHPCRSKSKTVAEVAVEIITEAPTIAANTVGRAKVSVREDAAKNGAWAWARLRERFGRDSGATSFTEVFRYSWLSEKRFEGVWREWVKKVSKLPQGSLSSQAIEQLTISGLSRQGQPELENHLRLRAPMAWQDIQTQL